MTEVRLVFGSFPYRGLGFVALVLGGTFVLGAGVAVVVAMTSDTSLGETSWEAATVLGLMGAIASGLGIFLRRMGVFASPEGLRSVVVRSRFVPWSRIRSTTLAKGPADRMLDLQVEGERPLRILPAQLGAWVSTDTQVLARLQELISQYREPTGEERTIQE